MTQQLASHSGLTDQDKNLLMEELNDCSKVKQLEKELEIFKSIYGFEPLSVKHDQVINILQDRVQTEQSLIDQARQKIESLQNVSHNNKNNINDYI